MWGTLVTMTTVVPAHDTGSALASLLRAVAEGDQSAFAQMYDAAGPMVYGTCLRILRDPDLAAEAMQDVMLEVWRTAKAFDEDAGSAGAWLAATAHRRAVDRARSVGASPARDGHAAVGDAARETDGDALRAEDAGLVAHGMADLTDAQLESVHLTYWEGLTCREVADRLGVALPTVTGRLRDGLTRLRLRLGT